MAWIGDKYEYSIPELKGIYNGLGTIDQQQDFNFALEALHLGGDELTDLDFLTIQEYLNTGKMFKKRKE
jgi:hypothetical protein